MKSLLAFFLLILPLACSNDTENTESLNAFVAGDYEVAIDDKSNSRGEVPFAQGDVEQKLIKESYLHFETDDLDKSYRTIAEIASKYKGYIQDDSSNKGYNKITRRINLRVPSQNFQNVVNDISAGVEYFDTKQITSRDVTEEFIDLEARLKAKKTLENRYLELLKKANNVKEIIEIERELSKIREEIEAKEGRLQYLQNKVSLSSISIEFYKRISETKVTKSYGSKMWGAIVSGFDGLSMFFLGILYIWPFIIILIIAFFLIKRWIAKRKKS